MDTSTGRIYEELPESLKKEEKINPKRFIRFGIGDKFEIMGGSFEIVEISPDPVNKIVLHSLEKGIEKP